MCFQKMHMSRPLTDSHATGQYPQIFVGPFVLNGIHRIPLSNHCISLTENISIGNAILQMKRTVETGIEHHETGIGPKGMNIAQMNIHPGIEKGILCHNLRIERILHPGNRNPQGSTIILLRLFDIFFTLISRHDLTPQIAFHIINRKIHPTTFRIAVQILGIVGSMVMK